MPSVVTGVRGLNQILERRQVPDMATTINLLEPSRYPLTTTMNALEKVKPAHNSIFRWMEDERLPDTDLVNGAQTAADATIEVDNGDFFRVGDILHVPRTGENLRVTAVAGDNLTTVRGVGAVAAAAMNDDEPIVIISPAQREGDTSRALLSTLEVEQFNYTQIVRTPFGVTNTQQASDLYDGNDLDYQAAKALIEHAVAIEKMLLFGQRSTATVSNQFLRTSGGLIDFVQTNRIYINGQLSEAEADQICQIAFRYGNSRKLLIGSPRVLNAFNQFGKNRLVTVPEDETYGFAMKRFTSQFGELDMTVSWLLRGTTYAGWAFVIDVDNLKLRPLRGVDGVNRYAQRIRNIQANDEDAQRDEYLSELGLEVGSEKTHLIFSGVQA